jgi:hypothetical protein
MRPPPETGAVLAAGRRYGVDIQSRLTPPTVCMLSLLLCFDVLQPDSASRAQVVSRLFNAP